MIFTEEQQVEILLSSLQAILPAARMFGPALRSKVRNINAVAADFCVGVQVASCTEVPLRKEEMLIEGPDCVRWIVGQLNRRRIDVTIKSVVSHVHLLEMRNPHGINIVNKYARISVAV